MGKKKTATSAKSTTPGNEPVTSLTPKRDAETAAAKTPALAKKAAKALTAVALGVGSVIATKRTKRKASTKASPPSAPTADSPKTELPHPPTHEEIAIRAYFISEARRAAGHPASPHQDWLEAESELLDSRRCRST